jgi:hypothetical protein
VVGTAIVAADRHESNTLPLLIQEVLILKTTVVLTELSKLVIVVKVEPGAELGSLDVVQKGTGSCCEGVSSSSWGEEEMSTNGLPESAMDWLKSS